MPKKAKTLSDLEVKNLAPGLHSVGGVAGLKLQVRSKTSKSWILRATIFGKIRDIGLGSYPDISLKAARQLASKYKEQILAGIDPVEERRNVKQAALASKAKQKTFSQVAEDYIEAVVEKTTSNPKSRQQWENTLTTYAYPHIGRLDISKVAKAHVIKILDPIWESKYQTASRLRGRIERIIDYAKARGLFEGENPALYKGNLESALPKIKSHTDTHHPALNYLELPEFISKLKLVNGLAAKALLFAILTATRSGEARGVTWDEIHLNDRMWKIPATRMKASKEHHIPLCNEAIKLLKSLSPQKSGLIFPSSENTPLTDASISKVIKKMHQEDLKIGGRGWIDKDSGNRVATPHGFRSTFRMWAADNVNMPPDIIEHALAHKLKDKVEAAYQRKTSLPKRVKLMDAWEEFCLGNNKTAQIINFG